MLVDSSDPLVTIPGAGRFGRLFGRRGSDAGAGVLRAVLVRRGRSPAAVVMSWSRLAALLREEVGRLAGSPSAVRGTMIEAVGVEA